MHCGKASYKRENAERCGETQPSLSDFISGIVSQCHFTLCSKECGLSLPWNVMQVWMYFSHFILCENVFLPLLMYCFCSRLYLAGMHFNENSNRAQAKTRTGKLVYVIPKVKKRDYSTRPLKSQATYRKLNAFIDWLFTIKQINSTL